VIINYFLISIKLSSITFYNFILIFNFLLLLNFLSFLVIYPFFYSSYQMHLFTSLLFPLYLPLIHLIFTSISLNLIQTQMIFNYYTF